MFWGIVVSMEMLAGIEERFKRLRGVLDERSRRLLVAAESEAMGPRGISTVARATGVSRQVIRQGIAELKEAAVLPERRIRRSGGGRKSAVKLDPSLKADLEELLESTTRGDPESALRWTCRSVRNLEAELKSRGHAVSHQVVADLLHELEYSLQANRKTSEGISHPDRNAQFEYVNNKVKQYLGGKEPGECWRGP
jgi:transposase